LTHKVNGMLQRPGNCFVAVLLSFLLAQTTSATDELVPDIDLLEFLGTIAGLENMGVEIDELLAGSAVEEKVETDAGTEVNKGENNE